MLIVKNSFTYNLWLKIKEYYKYSTYHKAGKWLHKCYFNSTVHKVFKNYIDRHHFCEDSALLNIAGNLFNRAGTSIKRLLYKFEPAVKNSIIYKLLSPVWTQTNSKPFLIMAIAFMFLTLGINIYKMSLTFSLLFAASAVFLLLYSVIERYYRDSLIYKLIEKLIIEV